MSQVRKRSIKGTIWIYIGFMIGALNTYFLTHKNWFTPDQNGLTRSLLDIGMVVFAFSSAGTSFYLYKFFPYYADNLEKKQNDLLGFALKISLIGFVITAAGLFLIEPLIVRKFGAHSALLVEYFYMTLPIAFTMLLYNLLESYSYGFNKGVTTNFLKEVLLRIYTLSVTLLKVFGFIDFQTFIFLFSLQYTVIVIALVVLLKREGLFWLTFRTSRVTQKFRKKIISMLSLTFIVLVVSVLRTAIDGIVLAARIDLQAVAVFGFASYLATIMQAPLRSIISITIPMLSREWKDKNHKSILKIYRRSSINMLSFSLFMFLLIWLNFEYAVQFFHLNPIYMLGKNIFLILGIVTIIEMGTGVTGQIIGTSTFFRFELWTNLLLTGMIIPLSYFLTVKYGLTGPALANLVSFSVYNALRYYFLLKKFNMQPFSKKTIEIFAIAIISYAIVYFISRHNEGLIWIMIRCILFSLFFIIPAYIRNISPDFKPVVATIRKRISRK